MPKLYEYFGLYVLFYSNEHEPIHVHGIDPDGREMKAEIIVKDGKIVRIRYLVVGNVAPLAGRCLRDFKALVSAEADDIVKKWVDFFVLKKPVKTVRITKRLA